AEKVHENNVPTWYVEIPDTVERQPDADAYARKYVELLEEQLEELGRDRDHWRSMALHLAANRTPTYEVIPLPAGPGQGGHEPQKAPASLPWWKRLFMLED